MDGLSFAQTVPGERQHAELSDQVGQPGDAAVQALSVDHSWTHERPRDPVVVAVRLRCGFSVDQPTSYLALGADWRSLFRETTCRRERDEPADPSLVQNRKSSWQ